MIEVASLRYGVIFKKAFRQPHIFTAFVKDFTGVDIEIEAVETEKSFSPSIGHVDIHFDLFAEDKKNRIIVDIQHQRLPDHYDRFLHYHCAALVEQIRSSDDYHPKMKVLTLVVLTSGDRHKTDVAITDFEPKDSQGNGLGETQHQLIYISPKYVNDATNPLYKEWLEAIDDTLDKKVNEENYHKPIIKQVFELIKHDKTTPQEYAKMKDEYAYGKYYEDKFYQQFKQQLKQAKQEKEKANREKNAANKEREKIIQFLKASGIEYKLE